MALKGNSVDEQIWNYFKSKGLNDYGIAGLMGNLYAESGLNPKNLQNNGNQKLNMTDDEFTSYMDSGKYSNFVNDKYGYGLAQWTYWSRKQNLLNFAKSKNKSIGDLEMQLDFLYKELSEGYKTVLSVLKTATSVLSASNEVLFKFERPANQDVSVQNKRASYGNVYYEKYASKSSNIGGAKMNIVESIMTKNPCYTKGEKITVKGLMIHSVGCPQPRATAFINNWNSPSYDRACVHAFIDGNDGTVYQTLPWNHRGWHGGGACNNTHIGVEMCEPACITYTSGSSFNCSNVEQARAVATRTYNSAVELFAMLCKQYNLNPLADGVVISHKEGCARGIASNHGDPEHLWTQLGLGYTMNGFRQDVSKAMGNVSSTTASAPSTNNTTTANNKYYRVRLSWDNAKSQLGAYTSLENAKKACKDGYTVYDWNGNAVYPQKTQSQNVSTSAPTTSKSVKEGDVIHLRSGCAYWNGKSIPSWVFNKTLYYRGTNNNGVVFSTVKVGAITGVVKASDVIELSGNSTNSTSTRKSNEEVAREIVKGIGGWGNGSERKSKLAAAGYDYATVQQIVNKLLS